MYPYALEDFINFCDKAQLDELEILKELNDKLNMFEYILPYKNGYEIQKDDYLKYYRLLSPKKFEYFNGGICWDYVLYEAYWLKKNTNIKFKSYLFCTEGCDSTHTFIIASIKNKYYWFESSWKHMRGIYEFNSEKEAIEKVTSVLALFEAQRNNHLKCYYTEYNPLSSDFKYEMSCLEMTEIFDKLPKKEVRLIPHVNILKYKITE